MNWNWLAIFIDGYISISSLRDPGIFFGRMLSTNPCFNVNRYRSSAYSGRFTITTYPSSVCTATRLPVCRFQLTLHHSTRPTLLQVLPCPTDTSTLIPLYPSTPCMLVPTYPLPVYAYTRPPFPTCPFTRIPSTPLLFCHYTFLPFPNLPLYPFYCSTRSPPPTRSPCPAYPYTRLPIYTSTLLTFCPFTLPKLTLLP